MSKIDHPVNERIFNLSHELFEKMNEIKQEVITLEDPELMIRLAVVYVEMGNFCDSMARFSSEKN